MSSESHCLHPLLPTSDLRFTGREVESSLGPLRSGLGQATYTCVPLTPSSIICYRPRGWSLWMGK